MHHHVLDWTMPDPIEPIVDFDGDTVDYMSFAMCSDGRVMVLWATSITGNVRCKIKLGYSESLETFVSTPGSVTTGITIFDNTDNSGGGAGVVHANLSVGPGGRPMIVFTGAQFSTQIPEPYASSGRSASTNGATEIHESFEIPGREDDRPGWYVWNNGTQQYDWVNNSLYGWWRIPWDDWDGQILVAWTTYDDGDTWDFWEYALSSKYNAAGAYPTFNSTTESGVLNNQEDRPGMIEYVPEEWNFYLKSTNGGFGGSYREHRYFTKALFHGGSAAGPALWEILGYPQFGDDPSTLFPFIDSRFLSGPITANPDTWEGYDWSLICGVGSRRVMDNGWAVLRLPPDSVEQYGWWQAPGVPDTVWKRQRFVALFQNQSDSTGGATSYLCVFHGLPEFEPGHRSNLDLPGGAIWGSMHADPSGDWDYEVTAQNAAIRRVGSLAGTSFTYTAGTTDDPNPFLALDASNATYARCVRSGANTVSIYGHVATGYPSASWTDEDEYDGITQTTPPFGWETLSTNPNWGGGHTRGRQEPYVYPLCTRLIIASADEITSLPIVRCFPPRPLHIPFKNWPSLRETNLAQAKSQNRENWAVLTRWCRDVWLDTQNDWRKNCPRPDEFPDLTEFRAPWPAPETDAQIEENWLALERWAESVCWADGLHIPHKRDPSRDEANWHHLERWASLQVRQ